MRLLQLVPASGLFLWLGATLLPTVAAGGSDGEEASYGPLYQEFKLTLDLGHRTEAVSPFFYRQTSGEPGNVTRMWAIPPLFCYGRNESMDTVFYDILWKGITYNRYESEYRWQLVQLFSFAGGHTQSETNVDRFTLFPFYFQQRSPVPELNYTAVVPFYGTLRNRLFRDEIHIVMFPLYAQGRKRDVVTDNYLYPFFHLRHGNGLRGWQAWPLLGKEHKEPTLKTNNWEEVETVPGHDKRFILWPIFVDNLVGRGTTNQTHEQGVLPFYTFFRSPMRDTTTYFWPLGVTHVEDREKKYSQWGAPWPFIVFARGEGKTTSRVFPFFSQAHNAALTSNWYLWPIYKYNRIHSDPLDRERRRICLFLYSDTSVKNTETGARARQYDLWPFFTSKRDLEGRHRLQIIAFLEPYLPNNVSVERDISPVWSLWRSEENPKTQATSQSLLWNLYRRETAPGRKKCSLLFGSFQYESGPDGRRGRVAYIPFGHRQEKTAAEPAPR
jgi:hypothetical protein